MIPVSPSKIIPPEILPSDDITDQVALHSSQITTSALQNITMFKMPSESISANAEINELQNSVVTREETQGLPSNISEASTLVSSEGQINEMSNLAVSSLEITNHSTDSVTLRPSTSLLYLETETIESPGTTSLNRFKVYKEDSIPQGNFTTKQEAHDSISSINDSVSANTNSQYTMPVYQKTATIPLNITLSQINSDPAPTMLPDVSASEFDPTSGTLQSPITIPIDNTSDNADFKMFQNRMVDKEKLYISPSGEAKSSTTRNGDTLNNTSDPLMQGTTFAIRLSEVTIDSVELFPSEGIGTRSPFIAPISTVQENHDIPGSQNNLITNKVSHGSALSTSEANISSTEPIDVNYSTQVSLINGATNQSFKTSAVEIDKASSAISPDAASLLEPIESSVAMVNDRIAINAANRVSQDSLVTNVNFHSLPLSKSEVNIGGTWTADTQYTSPVAPMTKINAPDIISSDDITDQVTSDSSQNTIHGLERVRVFKLQSDSIKDSAEISETQNNLVTEKESQGLSLNINGTKAKVYSVVWQRIGMTDPDIKSSDIIKDPSNSRIVSPTTLEHKPVTNTTQSSFTLSLDRLTAHTEVQKKLTAEEEANGLVSSIKEAKTAVPETPDYPYTLPVLQLTETIPLKLTISKVASGPASTFLSQVFAKELDHLSGTTKSAAMIPTESKADTAQFSLSQNSSANQKKLHSSHLIEANPAIKKVDTLYNMTVSLKKGTSALDLSPSKVTIYPAVSNFTTLEVGAVVDMDKSIMNISTILANITVKFKTLSPNTSELENINTAAKTVTPLEFKSGSTNVYPTVTSMPLGIPAQRKLTSATTGSPINNISVFTTDDKVFINTVVVASPEIETMLSSTPWTMTSDTTERIEVPSVEPVTAISTTLLSPRTSQYLAVIPFNKSISEEEGDKNNKQYLKVTDLVRPPFIKLTNMPKTDKIDISADMSVPSSVAPLRASHLSTTNEDQFKAADILSGTSKEYTVHPQTLPHEFINSLVTAKSILSMTKGTVATTDLHHNITLISSPKANSFMQETQPTEKPSFMNFSSNVQKTSSINKISPSATQSFSFNNVSFLDPVYIKDKTEVTHPLVKTIISTVTDSTLESGRNTHPATISGLTDGRPAFVSISSTRPFFIKPITKKPLNIPLSIQPNTNSNLRNASEDIIADANMLPNQNIGTKSSDRMTKGINSTEKLKLESAVSNWSAESTWRTSATTLTKAVKGTTLPFTSSSTQNKTITAPLELGCSKEITIYNGSAEYWWTPNYPENYPEGISCRLSIIVPSSFTDGLVLICFKRPSRIFTKDKENCTGDHITVSLGGEDSETRLCGDIRKKKFGIHPEIRSESSKYTITFKSTVKDRGSEKGVKLTVEGFEFGKRRHKLKRH